MGIIKLDFNKNNFVGLYGFATDSYCLIGDVEHEKAKQIENALEVDVIKSRLVGTDLAGIFAAGNSSGLIVPSILFDWELKHLNSKVKTLVLDSRYTAMGNLIVANDKGCIVSPLLSKSKDKISEFLGVPVEVSTVAGLELPGSLCLATNKGCIIHKEAEKEERKLIEKTLGVKSGAATINFGSFSVKVGVIANSKGMAAGGETTGPELENIAELLGFV